MARYICIEGTEGVGKTTQVQKLVDHYRALGYNVLQTREPGTPHSPLTMELRNIMLNAKYESEMTAVARELVTQTIRSIHLEKVIAPALKEYDFIIQDRGLLSGFAYGDACGHDINWLFELSNKVSHTLGCSPVDMYNDVILLVGNVETGLNNALSSKQEFEAGDAIEMKGLSFMKQVNSNMSRYSRWFNATPISIDGKSIQDVFTDIVNALDIRSKK